MLETVLNRVSYQRPATEDEDFEEEGARYDIPSRQFSLGIGECKIIRDDFGVYKDCETDDGRIIHRYTLLNKEVTVQVLTYGATVSAVTIPDKNGVIDDVLLGFDTYEEYRNTQNPYFGATIGRITGVIPNCEFSIENEKYYLSNNYLSVHHANGGFIGFDKVMWNAYVANDKVFMTYMSEDAEEGYPGDVLVTKCFELTTRNELIIETTAKCTKPTPIDVTTHLDWNLAGHSGGPEELCKHYLLVNADKYAQHDKDYILTGKLKKVSQTVMDFRVPRNVGKLIHKIPGGGFDHFLKLTRGTHKSVTFAAKLMHPDSGRYVEVITDQPGLLIYSQNNLYAHKNFVEGHPISCWVNDARFLLQQRNSLDVFEPEDIPKENFEDEIVEEQVLEEIVHEGYEDGEGSVLDLEYRPLVGKQGVNYLRHSGMRLVPMNYPEPVARKRNYANYVINPGETYLNTTIFKLGTKYEKPINLAEVIVPDASEPLVELPNEPLEPE